MRPARAVFINQYGSLGRIHGLDPYLRRLPVGNSPARGIRASRDPRVSRGGTIREWAWPPQFLIRPCVALWQQPGEATSGFAEQID